MVELHLRTPFTYNVISYDGEHGLYISRDLYIESAGEETLAYRYYILNGDDFAWYFRWYDDDGDRLYSDADRYVFEQEEVSREEFSELTAPYFKISPDNTIWHLYQ